MGRCFTVVILAAMLAGTAPARAAVVERPAPLAGEVIQARGGEEGQLIPEPGWRGLEVRQDLKAGDVLRTNATGTLAILFADETQIRLGRNATLVVKEIGPGGPTRFNLTSGSLWARAPRGNADLVIETPAASAAVRGTDWTLAVEGDRTAITVLDGAVEFANPQGTLLVRAGEAAVARIGEAPSRTLLVQRSDREQLLFYVSLRDTFRFLPSTPASSAELRAMRDRLAAIPPERRTAADWLDAADVGLGLDGLDAARHALAEARARRLSPREAARADLVAGLIAGAERRWNEAGRLFAEAAPGLDPERRAIAAYAAFFAAALADPSRAVTPPDRARLPDTPAVAAAEAFIAAYLGDFDGALAILAAAEARFPDNAELPALTAQVALLADRRDAAAAAAGRSLALDPDNPEGLRARARQRASNEGDLDGALADLTRATAIAPGASDGWNDLALLQDARNATREAEAAARTAIAADPEDPVARANYAILLLDQSRVDAAKAEIDAALALDPSFSAGLLARGRLRLQTGDTEGAIRDLLAASVADPLYSNALLALGIAYYQAGEVAPAEQQIELADRLDPNDPVVALVRAAFATDQYRADDAIIAARDAVLRSRGRGGAFASLAATRDGGSVLADSFRTLGLEAWAQYYGDVVFDRFSAGGYFDRSIVAAVTPFYTDAGTGSANPDEYFASEAFSILLQGMLLDPLAISAPERSLNVFRTPFIETKIGGSGILTSGGTGGEAHVEVQGFSNHPFPVAYFARGDLLSEPATRDNSEWTIGSGTAFVGAEPAPYTRLLLFALHNDVERGLPGPIVDPTLSDSRDFETTAAGIGVSHTFGERNVGQAIAVVSNASSDTVIDRRIATPSGDFGSRSDTDAEQQTGLVGASHLIGIGPADLVYGLEAGLAHADTREVATLFIPTLPPLTAVESSSADLSLGRAFADVLVRLTPTLTAQAGIAGVTMNGGSTDLTEVNPRLGLGYSPFEGHWLRAAAARETSLPTFISLAPQATVGLLPAEAPVALGGEVDSAMLRWDAEWTKRFFTAVEYQHQSIDRVNFTVPLSVIDYDLDKGSLDRISATANVWLGHGFGLSATYARTWSDIDDDGDDTLAFEGNPLPYLPHDYARGVLTYVHPSRVTAKAAVTWLGDRRGDVAGTRLEDVALLDLGASWESDNRRLFLGLDVYNLLDDEFDLAPGTPGWGRTGVLRGEVRF